MNPSIQTITSAKTSQLLLLSLSQQTYPVCLPQSITPYQLDNHLFFHRAELYQYMNTKPAIKSYTYGVRLCWPTHWRSVRMMLNCLVLDNFLHNNPNAPLVPHRQRLCFITQRSSPVPGTLVIGFNVINVPNPVCFELTSKSAGGASLKQVQTPQWLRVHKASGLKRNDAVRRRS